MGSVSPKMSLDFIPNFVPKTISDFLHEISTVENVVERASKLNDFVKRLEEEMQKIDAFKRELPYCMILLNDAITAVKESSLQCGVANAKPVFEEFIPLIKDSDGSDETDENERAQDCRDKKEWMSSFQLWRSDDCQNSPLKTKRKEERNYVAAENRPTFSKNKNEEKKFAAFQSYSGFPLINGVKKEEKIEAPICTLSLVTPSLKNIKDSLDSSILRSSGYKETSTVANIPSNPRTVLLPQQPARKQRRCWSPELHRRFVNALQQLGGSQVATPKQIREFMQVDGLTNDEVKSHLQKYRLHTRRLPSTAAPASADQSAVVLGDLWMSEDGNGESSSKVSSYQSASPQGPLQLGGNGGYSTTGGDSVEDEEDAKSESYSYWKTNIQTGKK